MILRWVTAHHGTTDSSDCWVVKLNELGAIQWQQSLGGTNNDLGYTIQQTMDGGYILASVSFSNNGDVVGHHGSNENGDLWVVKYSGGGCSAALQIITSQSSGSWNDPATWAGGIVPCSTSQVIIKNKVTVSQNAMCYSLTVNSPNGNLIINTGNNLSVLH